MVSGFVTSPFDHSRIWSGLASEMRIALKLLTSSMVLLRAAVWLGYAMRTVGERVCVGQDADPRGGGGAGLRGPRAGPGGRGSVTGSVTDDQSSNPARLIPPRSGSR